MTGEPKYLAELFLALGVILVLYGACEIGRHIAATFWPPRPPQAPAEAKRDAKSVGMQPRPPARPAPSGPLWQNSRTWEASSSRGRAEPEGQYCQTEPLPEVDMGSKAGRRRAWPDEEAYEDEYE